MARFPTRCRSCGFLVAPDVEYCSRCCSAATWQEPAVAVVDREAEECFDDWYDHGCNVSSCDYCGGTGVDEDAPDDGTEDFDSCPVCGGVE